MNAMKVDTPIARVLAFLIPALSVSIMGIIVDLAILNRGLEQFVPLTIASVCTGITAGVLVLQQSVCQYDNQRIKRERTIAEMNHHIRNALTVVLFYGAQGEDAEARLAVRQAAQRIEWTLEAILPEGWSQEPETYLTQKRLRERARRLAGSATAGTR